MEPQEIIFDYHQRTKHGFGRYARSLGYLDWETQPDPFRRFEGAEAFPLPFIEDPKTSYEDMVLGSKRSLSFSVESLSKLLELSFGLSAWKEFMGERWALRMNPSSGNLHPTEACVLLAGVGKLKGGLYHYDPLGHLLELRLLLPEPLAYNCRNWFGSEGFLVGLTSVFWREAWKYGERAFRYCQLDLGHALGALRFAAGMLGWKASVVEGLGDREMRAIMGLDRTVWPEGEEESPGLMAIVQTGGYPVPFEPPQDLIEALTSLTPLGRPNLLSKGHVRWEAIEEVAEASSSPKPKGRASGSPMVGKPALPFPEALAARVIRSRRSGLEYNQKSQLMPQEAFLALLERLLPFEGLAPFDALHADPCIHPLFFIHRLEGLKPGLYLLVRHPKSLEELHGAMDQAFYWERAFNGLPFYRLKAGDVRSEAMYLSCQQNIAGFGVFALSMLGRFRPMIEQDPHAYKRLHWEAGLVGQALYLEAEAWGLRGTGIGCFFDDELHAFFGLKDDTYQVIYNFAVGYPLEDRRLTTQPPYAHIERKASP